MAGTAARPRASVFRGGRRIEVQLIDDVAKRTILGASVASAPGSTKTDQARALGKDIAQQAKEKGIKSIVFDRGGYRYHGRVKAVAEGMREAGIEF